MGLGLRLLGVALAIGSLGCGGEEDPAPHAVRASGQEPPEEEPTAGRGTTDDAGAADAGAVADSGFVAGSGAPENPLLGSWLDQVGSCTYTHTFDDAGIYREVATTGERVEATYELSPPTDAVDRWFFSFTIISDNNVVDCEGQQNDETGDAHSAYLGFVGDDRVDVYRGPQDPSPGFSWTRE